MHEGSVAGSNFCCRQMGTECGGLEEEGQLMKGVCGECWVQKSDCHGLEAKFGGENSHWSQKFGYEKNK